MKYVYSDFNISFSCKPVLGVLFFLFTAISMHAQDDRVRLPIDQTKQDFISYDKSKIKELKEKSRTTKLSTDLVRMMEMHDEGKMDMHGERSFMKAYIMKDQAIMVQVTTLNADACMTELKSGGLKEAKNYSVAKHIITGYASMDMLAKFGDMTHVWGVKSVMKPITNIGAATSQADVSLCTDITRVGFGVDGTGNTIGVLSDSHNSLGGEASGIATGDLPGPGNPNGFTTPINNLVDLPHLDGSDEGRAMFELIHDVAPGAELAFSSAFVGGQAGFAQGILDLQSVANCNIIVDDVIYFAEPMWMDGVVAQAVNTVVSNGAMYFSSAGNSDRDAYDGAYTPMAPSDPINLANNLDAHDIGGSDDLLQFTVPAGLYTIILQWNEPHFSTTGTPGTGQAMTDLDFDLYNETGTIYFGGSYDDNLFTTGDPVEGVQGSFDAGTYSLKTLRFDAFPGTPPPDKLKYIVYSAGGSVVWESGVAGTNGPTCTGHANTAGACAVGASAYIFNPKFGFDPPGLNIFSSWGGVPICRDVTGAPITPIDHMKPDFTAPDGTNTTFFGFDFDGDGLPNFFGTSAAAPHAAATAALIFEADPAQSVSDVKSLMRNTAIDVSNLGLGFDYGSGTGLIQAPRAVNMALGANVAPNCHDINLGIAADGFARFFPHEIVSNTADGVGLMDLTLSNTHGSTIFERKGVLPTDVITITNACNYRGQELKLTVKGELATCWSLVTFKQESPAALPGRITTVWCTDPLVAGGHIGDEPPTAFIPCEGASPSEFVADWIIPVDTCGIDTAKIILREYAAFNKAGIRSSVFDTIVVFRLPEITEENLHCPATDTLYCGSNDRPVPGMGDTAFYVGPELYKFNPATNMCDTIYLCYVRDENRDGWYQENEWYSTDFSNKCGVLMKKKVHKFEDPCSPIYKVELEIKQVCAGGAGDDLCAVAANPAEEIGNNYWQCDFWVYDFDTVPPVVDGKQKLDEFEEVVVLDADCDGDVDTVVIAPTGTHDCAAHTYLPAVVVNDNWTGVKHVKAQFEGSTYVMELEGERDTVGYLAGNGCYRYHTPVKVPKNDWPSMIVYEAYDNCHLLGTDTCWILAKDRTKPVVVTDKGVTVSLSDKKVWVDAESFNEGSWDNCGEPRIFVRRTDWYESCIDLCYNVKDAECGVHDPDTESAVEICYISEHHDTLRQAILESDKLCDPVEAHYATYMEWLCNDGTACGEILYNAWIYDLIKYGTINCVDHPYDVDEAHIRKLIKEMTTWSFDAAATASKFKFSTTHLHECYDGGLTFGLDQFGSQQEFETEIGARIDNYAQIGGGWTDQVAFDCEDACSMVTVEVLAIDYWCNWSKAWMDVWVEDKTPVSVVNDVVDGEISCKTYKDKRYDYPGEQHPVSIEYIVEQAKTDSTAAYTALDHIFGGYQKAWVDPHGNYVDTAWMEIEKEIEFSDSVCVLKDSIHQIRVYDDHFGYIWADSLVGEVIYEEQDLEFQRGIVTVNCAENVQCSQEVWCEFDHCGQGYLFRKFKIWQGCPPDSDAYSPHAPDTIYRHQRIWVGNDCELHKYMFDVPQDTTIEACGIEYDPDGSTLVVGDAGPENTGMPEYLLDDDCRIVGIARDDKVFKIVGGDEGCYKIIRTWYFADWCGGKPSNDYWYQDRDLVQFSCEQKILVIDTEPPVCNIVISGDTSSTAGSSADSPAFFEAAGGCVLDIVGTVDVQDPCGLIDLGWELKDLASGTVVAIGSGSVSDTADVFDLLIDSVLPGSYKLNVQVRDECQNENYCEYYFDVAAGKKPGPVCVTSLTAELQPWDTDQDGVVDTAASKIWAFEFESSSLPPCGEDYADLDFMIEWADESSGVYDTTAVSDSLAIGCDRIGSQVARMWVVSPTGGADYCDVILVVQDNSGTCDDMSSSGPQLVGTITNELGESVELVDVKAVINGEEQIQTTNESGEYRFSMVEGQEIEVAPIKDIDDLNGVSTLDLVRIQKHVLGKELLANEFREVAADANKDGNISPLDLVEIRKVILGSLDKFQYVNSWHFFEENAQDEQVTITPGEESMILDWMGIKMGDVNMDSDPSRSAGRSGKALTFALENMDLVAGNQYVVEFTSADFTDITGYQFTLQVDPSKARILSVDGAALEMDESNFGFRHLEEGVLTTSWNTYEGLSMSKDEVLFTVTLEAKAGAELSNILAMSNDVTASEAYNSAELTHQVSLDFGLEDAATLFALHQNSPNPFKETTTVGFHLPDAMPATISVYTSAGKQVKLIEGDFVKGLNTIQLSRKDVGNFGVLYYQLDTEHFTASRKMILIE